MKAESWADDIEQWWALGDVYTREITEFAELSVVIQPFDTQPVVQTLHQQIDLLLQFKFDNGQAASACHAENVNHSAVGRGKCRNLRVDIVRRQRGINPRDVPHHKAFQPASDWRW